MALAIAEEADELWSAQGFFQSISFKSERLLDLVRPDHQPVVNIVLLVDALSFRIG